MPVRNNPPGQAQAVLPSHKVRGLNRVAPDHRQVPEQPIQAWEAAPVQAQVQVLKARDHQVPARRVLTHAIDNVGLLPS